jgi:hypothetical protein
MTGCLCSRDGSFLYGDRSFPNRKMKGLVSSGQLVFPGFAPYSLACLYRNSTSAAAVERGSDDPAKFNVGSSWRGAGEREGWSGGCVPISSGSILLQEGSLFREQATHPNLIAESRRATISHSGIA